MHDSRLKSHSIFALRIFPYISFLIFFPSHILCWAFLVFPFAVAFVSFFLYDLFTSVSHVISSNFIHLNCCHFCIAFRCSHCVLPVGLRTPGFSSPIFCCCCTGCPGVSLAPLAYPKAFYVHSRRVLSPNRHATIVDFRQFLSFSSVSVSLSVPSFFFFHIFYSVFVVVRRLFHVHVENTEVYLGNSALIKCAIPEYVRPYVRVASWHRGEEILLPELSDVGECSHIFTETHTHPHPHTYTQTDMAVWALVRVFICC